MVDMEEKWQLRKKIIGDLVPLVLKWMGVGWRLKKTTLCSQQCKEFLCTELQEKVHEIFVGNLRRLLVKESKWSVHQDSPICAKELKVFEGGKKAKHGGPQLKLLPLQGWGKKMVS